MEVSIPLLNIFLVAGRMGGMIFTAPIFGSRNYPVPMKIGLIFFTTVLVYPFVNATVTYDVSTFLEFGLLLMNELMIGLFIGLLISVYFNFIYFAGDIIDHQVGFSIISVVNPLDESQIPITANVFYVFSTLIFLQLNLHHELITALVYSYTRIALGSFFNAADSLRMIVDIVQQSFIIGLQIAAPFMITILISDIILGLLSKAMPGLNIFVIGMPFKVFFGLLLFIVLMPYLYEIFAEILDSVFYYLKAYFELYSP